MKFGTPFKPMLLTQIEKPFNDEKFLYELKFDGYRATIHVSNSKFIIYNRNGYDITYLYPELNDIKKNIKENCIFDGEIVSFEKAKPSFSKLQERSHTKDENKIKYFKEHEPVCFIAFDCLYKNKDLTNLPLLERKKILNKFKDTNYFVKTKYFLEKGIDLFKQVKKEKLEGIVAKKIDSKYTINTRSKEWIKIKNIQEGIFLIGGYQETKIKVSLLLGEFKEDKFLFLGKVSITKDRELYKKLIKEKKKNISPFFNYQEKNVIYLEPNIKCEITYLERTKNNQLRHPVFKRASSKEG